MPTRKRGYSKNKNEASPTRIAHAPCRQDLLETRMDSAQAGYAYFTLHQSKAFGVSCF